ncbi:MAG: sulfatase-like hydrolase/transferase, partial [Acidobacteria bacterium]|nr:sulfatase-like hydrolase/transferase [Acidobacteriota bacterium]
MFSRRETLRLLSGAGAASLLGAQQRKPNVLLFLTDDMGYGDLACYGAGDTRTPNIDRLGREGVRFTQCYSNGPVCTPTRAGLMTGRYQQRVGLEWAIPPAVRGWGLETKETSLPRMLKDSGYATAMYGKWHLGYEPQYGPNAHGFDEFFGILSGNVDHYTHKEINGDPDLYENTKPVEKAGYMTDLINERAVDYVNRQGRNPFFLYIAYNATHWPFQAPGRPNDTRTRPTWFNGTRADYVQMTERIDR